MRNAVTLVSGHNLSQSQQVVSRVKPPDTAHNSAAATQKRVRQFRNLKTPQRTRKKEKRIIKVELRTEAVPARRNVPTTHPTPASRITRVFSKRKVRKRETATRLPLIGPRVRDNVNTPAESLPTTA